MVQAALFSLNPLHRLILKLEKQAFENPDLKLLFTNSHMVRNEILEHYQVDPNKIRVIHNGVEWNEMQSDFDSWESNRLKLARKRGLNLNRYQFLFIGHNYRRKGLAKLLKALSLLFNRDFDLSVVGAEKHLKEFQQLTIQLKLQNHVHFFGPQKDTRSFYQIADALLSLLTTILLPMLRSELLPWDYL